MFDGRDLDGTAQLVDGRQAALESRAAAAGELSARLADLSATAGSPDELVQVTVGANGAVTALRLDEAIRRQPAQDTAWAILATLARAQAALTAAAAQATAETIGAGSATGQAVIASYAARQGRADD
jgi:hypothetical protein